MEERSGTMSAQELETDADGNPCLRPGYNLTNADWKEIWKVRNAHRREENVINICELSVRYSADGKRWYLVRNAPAIEQLASMVEPRIEQGADIIAEESTATPYRYMCEAWCILIHGQSAKWKTVGMLRTLRQAIREHSAQMMPIDLPPGGAGLNAVRKFLAIARHYDAVHHGQQTF
jgi:hypothetical protein